MYAAAKLRSPSLDGSCLCYLQAKELEGVAQPIFKVSIQNLNQCGAVSAIWVTSVIVWTRISVHSSMLPHRLSILLFHSRSPTARWQQFMLCTPHASPALFLFVFSAPTLLLDARRRHAGLQPRGTRAAARSDSSGCSRFLFFVLETKGCCSSCIESSRLLFLMLTWQVVILDVESAGCYSWGWDGRLLFLRLKVIVCLKGLQAIIKRSNFFFLFVCVRY